MTLLNWKEDFALGVPQIDAEHRGLIEAMNRVHELDQQKAGMQAVDTAIQRLIELTVRHFADEEAHMERIGFSQLRGHKLIHKNMLARVDELYEAFKQGDGSVGRDFYRFLTHWLTAHICHIDRKYTIAPQPTA